MAIYFGAGAMVATTWKTAPTICEDVQFDVEYSVNVTWKGQCVDTAKTYGDKLAFYVKRGDYMRIVMTVKNRLGDLVDVSGFDAIEYVIAKDVKGYPLVTKSVANGGIVVGQDGSTVVIELLTTDTATLPQEYCYHECRMTNGDEAQTVFSGWFKTPETILGMSA